MLRPFRIPETRLLAINELVAQVTLTFRTDEDEEVRYRYEQDSELQSLVQTAVVSLVNCGYTTGMARGPGFVLHQLRKKWPIGRRYIFTRDGDPLQSSLHKYFFQLELVDDIDERQDAPMLEIVELRGVGLSPSASSMAGSTIEGLDAVNLPPMAAIFGQGYPQMGDPMGHRRSGSAYSVHSGYSDRSERQRPQSPFYCSSGRRRPESPSPRRSLEPRAEELESEYRHAHESVYAELAPASHGASVRGVQPGEPGSVGSPMQSTVRTRSLSRSSVGSVRTMQSVEMHGRSGQVPAPQVRPSAVAAAAGSAQRPTGIPAPRPQPAASSAKSQSEQQPRLGRTTWYRSLHGISPLARQPKSLSSSDNEAALGARLDAGEMASQIPRVAGNAHHGSPASSRPPRAPAKEPSGLNALASRFKRKILSPINIHREKQRSRPGSRLAREVRSSDAGSDGVDTSDFTGPESDGASDGEARGSAIPVPASAIPVPASAIPVPVSTARRAADADGKLGEPAHGSAARGAIGVVRPDMPPPKKRPTRPQSAEPLPESVPIPASVRDALLRRLKSPLGRHADKAASRLSVRERIAAFNNMTVANGVDGAEVSVRPPSSTGILTPVTQESADGRSGADVADKPGALRHRPAVPAPSTPPVSAGATARTRIGTKSGFISVASPGAGSGLLLERPQSRASTANTGRPASPALSLMSNVSTRVQDAISSLERAYSNANNPSTPRNGDAQRPAAGGSGLSGTKRGAAADQLDYLASPTKRPRAPSAAVPDNARPGSRLNPLNMVQRMVRRHTGR